MCRPIALEWHFDRSQHDEGSPFSTFSVGIYQWLPKSSGRGLKKSKSIRVKGYVAEPDRVYEKAEQLCQQLNAERVHADNPPEWLQKQYSVPRPNGLVIESTGEGLSGSTVRRARIKMMRHHLLPTGFIKGNGGTYVRDRESQIHVVDFQPSKWGHEYTVNLGFHYSFLPPFLHRSRCSLAEFHLLDCAFQTRIGSFIGDGRDVWFAYGDDLEALKNVLTQNAVDCLRIFEDTSSRWADPQEWVSGSRKRPSRLWRASHFQLFLACLEIHHGSYQDAAVRLQKLASEAKWESDKQFYAKLLRKARSGKS